MKLLKWPYLLLLLLGFFSLSPVQAKPYKGVELITRETYKYGAFEARVRSAKGSGMVTAFFLWKDGSEIPGSQWQEQDFEMFGKDGKYQTQLMTPGNPRTENAVIHALSAPSTDHYFTYRMEWTPTYLAFYVDGHLVRRETDRVIYAKMFEPLAEPTQLRMSLWAGDFPWSGSFDATAVPAHTYVEFLQIFNYTPGTGPDGSDFTLRWRDDFAVANINTARWWFANWTFEFAVNDYVSRNAAVRNGKLVLALTSDATSGQFPATAPADNPPLPPFDTAGPQPQNVTPILIPGRIEAENFSGYRDNTLQNDGNSNCISSLYFVDVETTLDTSGVCHVSHTLAGEWTEYTIEVAEAGEYYLFLRAASGRAGTQVHVEMEGLDVSGPVAIPGSGWQVFSDVPVQLTLAAGVHRVRVVHDTGFVNINYLEFDLVQPPQPVVLPARIEAEAYINAFDTTPGNSGPVKCGTGDVDFELTDDSAGVCNIANTVAGEWTEYLVSTTGGKFDLTVRAATGRLNISFRVLIDGLDVSGPLPIPGKGWQVYTSLLVPVELPAGTYTVRLVYDTGFANINFINFALASSSSSVGSSVASSIASSSVASSSVASSAVASSSSSLSSSVSSASSSVGSSVESSSIASSSASSVGSSSIASSSASSVESSSVASSSASSVASSSVASSVASSVESSSIASSSVSSVASSSSIASSVASSAVPSSVASSVASSVESSSVASSSASSVASSVVSSVASSSVASSSASSAVSSSVASSSASSAVSSSVVSSRASSAVSSSVASSRASSAVSSSVASSRASSAVSSSVASSRASSAVSSRVASSAAASNCTYVVVSNWGSGFSGAIRITNRGTSAINAWNVNWTYAGSTRVTSNWSADMTGTNPYSASNMTWNGRILPNQTVEFGFLGTHSGTAEIPVVRGSVCN